MALPNTRAAIDFALCAVAVVSDAKNCEVAIGGLGDGPAPKSYHRNLRSTLDKALTSSPGLWMYATTQPPLLQRGAICYVAWLFRQSTKRRQAGTQILDKEDALGAAHPEWAKPYCRRAQPPHAVEDFLRHELGATGTHVGCEHTASVAPARSGRWRGKSLLPCCCTAKSTVGVLT